MHTGAQPPSTLLDEVALTPAARGILTLFPLEYLVGDLSYDATEQPATAAPGAKPSEKEVIREND
mgnify:CR=1 FL=1